MIKIGKISKAILHYIGNMSSNQGVRFSDILTDVDAVSKDLMKVISTSFRRDDLYQFADILNNKAYFAVNQIFADQETFIKNSKLLAKQLYEQGNSTKIKSGNLWIILLNDVLYDHKTTEGIAILKSESIEKRIICTPTANGYDISEVETYNIKKIDKGCVIVNSESNEGYLVSYFVNSKGSYEEKYWRDMFLNLKSCQSSYQQTKAFVELCNDYVKGQLRDVDKKEKSLIYARIKSMLKVTEQINIEEFASIIFDYEDAANFVKYYKNQRKFLQLPENISIDSKQVKTKKAFTPQTIHLDSNFEINIYGGDGYLTKGVDTSNGLNYYKLFYDEEH